MNVAPSRARGLKLSSATNANNHLRNHGVKPYILHSNHFTVRIIVILIIRARIKNINLLFTTSTKQSVASICCGDYI